jgi:hypothetical protein
MFILTGERRLPSVTEEPLYGGHYGANGEFKSKIPRPISAHRNDNTELSVIRTQKRRTRRQREQSRWPPAGLQRENPRSRIPLRDTSMLNVSRVQQPMKKTLREELIIPKGRNVYERLYSFRIQNNTNSHEHNRTRTQKQRKVNAFSTTFKEFHLYLFLSLCYLILKECLFTLIACQSQI